jgi:hypothetical protein
MTTRVKFFTWGFTGLLAALMGQAVHLRGLMYDDLGRRVHDRYLRELSLAETSLESREAVDPDWPWLRDCRTFRRHLGAHDELACFFERREAPRGPIRDRDAE